jgi:hypothetical protein
MHYIVSVLSWLVGNALADSYQDGRDPEAL